MAANDDPEQWRAGDFNRRHYYVEGEALDRAKEVELIIKVDGRIVTHVQAREPGIVAFVSRPDVQGFDIELVQPGGFRYTDFRTPDGETTEPVAPWQLEALGLRGKAP